MNFSFILKRFLDFIYEILHWGFYYPIVLLCIIGLITNPSFVWVALLIMTFILMFLVDSTSQFKSTFNTLNEVEEDFFKKGENLELHEISVEDFLDFEDYAEYISPLLNRFSNIKYIKKIGLSPYFTKKPVRVFYVQSKQNKLIGAAKAYVAYLSSSFVFIHNRISEMNSHQKFIFYHEIEHVKAKGLFLSIHKQDAKYWVWLNPIILSFFMSAWWQFLVLIIYVTAFYIYKIMLIEGYSEAMADNNAFRKIPENERLDTINSLLKVRQREQKSAIKKNVIEKIKELKVRLFFIEEWKRVAESGYEPSRIKWNYGIPYLLLLPFCVFFFQAGINTTSTFVIPLILLGLLIVMFLIKQRFFSNLAINQIHMIDSYLESITSKN